MVNIFRIRFSHTSSTDVLTFSVLFGSLALGTGGGFVLALKIGAASKTLLPVIGACLNQKISRRLMRQRIFSKSSFGYCRRLVGRQERVLW